MAEILEALEVVLARLQPDRDPLMAYLDETSEHGPARRLQVLPSAIAPAPGRGRLAGMAGRVARRNVTRAKRLALPAALGAALMVLALVRLPSANTAWTQQLTVASNVGTADFKCDPVKLAFVETVKVGNDTKFVYALSGGGGTGPKCQDKDIASVFIPVCFNPALKPGGDVVAESHPGSATASWKAASAQKRLTWDAVTTTAPLGGKGPFDPAQVRFSFTLAGTVATSATQAHAGFKAGPNEFDAGLVKVPACPLPQPLKAAAPASSAASSEGEPPAATTTTPTPTAVPTATPTTAPAPSSGRGIGGSTGPAAPPVKPSATPTPLGVMIWN